MKRLALALIAASSCARTTEVVVRVSGDNLAAPTDVDQVRFTVTNPAEDPMGASPVYASPNLPLCAAGQTAGCYSFPISLTLYPGTRKPDDAIRVEVEALLAGAPVISDAAVFTFSRDLSERLDFILSKNCLMTTCANMDRACDRSGLCQQVAPAVPPPANADLATPGDVEFVGGAAFQGAGPTISFPAPPGLQANDFILLAVIGQNLSAPADWQTLSSKMTTSTSTTSAVFAHTAGLSEPSSYPIAAMTGSMSTLHSVVLRGVDHVDNLIALTLKGTGGTVTLPPLRTRALGAYVVVFMSGGNCLSVNGAQPLGTDGIWGIFGYAQPQPGPGTSMNASSCDLNSQSQVFEVALAPR